MHECILQAFVGGQCPLVAAGQPFSALRRDVFTVIEAFVDDVIIGDVHGVDDVGSLTCNFPERLPEVAPRSHAQVVGYSKVPTFLYELSVDLLNPEYFAIFHDDEVATIRLLESLCHDRLMPLSVISPCYIDVMNDAADNTSR